MRLQVLHLIEYRINFVFDVFLRFVEFSIFFYFWKSIFAAQGSIPGWDIPSLLILFAFQQIFLSFFLSFAAGSYEMEKAIMRGDIDKYLSRPIQPWFALLGENSFAGIGGFITGMGVLAIAHFALGIPIFTLLFPLLIIMVFLAALISTFFGLTMGSLAFWFGRTRLFDFITDAFWEFDSYPITLFPGYIQTLTAFTLPFLFATATPALASTGKIALPQLLELFALEILVLGINVIVFRIVWKEGVKQYESYGG